MSKTKEPKQKRLPGHELPTIPKIDGAADSYRELRDERMKTQKEEIEAAEHLRDLMHEHGLTVYEYDGYQVSLSALEKVKVRTKKEATNGQTEE